jgi:ribonuclease VapC
MVIDSSALVAILLEELGWEDIASAVEASPVRLVSAASLVEASIVIEARKGADGGRDLDLLIYRTGIEIASLDAVQAELARVAWRQYGKGNHPAALNYGDLFAYALAKATGQPLHYRGRDFARTDLVSALSASSATGP